MFPTDTTSSRAPFGGGKRARLEPDPAYMTIQTQTNPSATYTIHIEAKNRYKGSTKNLTPGDLIFSWIEGDAKEIYLTDSEVNPFLIEKQMDRGHAYSVKEVKKHLKYRGCVPYPAHPINIDGAAQPDSQRAMFAATRKPQPAALYFRGRQLIRNHWENCSPIPRICRKVGFNLTSLNQGQTVVERRGDTGPLLYLRLSKYAPLLQVSVTAAGQQIVGQFLVIEPTTKADPTRKRIDYYVGKIDYYEGTQTSSWNDAKRKMKFIKTNVMVHLLGDL